jgi:hypothetical protein
MTQEDLLKKIPKMLRKTLVDNIERDCADVDHVAVSLSGGTDSIAAALAARDAGKEVTAYTFCLEGNDGTDIRVATDVAKTFGFAHVVVPIGTNLGVLYNDTCALIRKFGLRKKTDIECMWPFLYLHTYVEQPIIVSGFGGDVFYINQRNFEIMVRDDESPKKIDELRATVTDFLVEPQGVFLDSHAGRYGVVWSHPWVHDSMVETFKGTTWSEVNRPRPKWVTYAAFPEIEKLTERPMRQSLQKGTSHIADHFDKLLRVSQINRKGHQAIVGLFNEIARERKGR